MVNWLHCSYLVQLLIFSSTCNFSPDNYYVNIETSYELLTQWRKYDSRIKDINFCVIYKLRLLARIELVAGFILYFELLLIKGCIQIKTIK